VLVALFRTLSESCSLIDNYEMRFDCGRCVLRPWAPGDEPSLARHANNYEVWRNLRDSFPHPYTLADAKRWISFTQQQSPQTLFAVEVGGEAVGGVGLYPKSDIERLSAEIGYWLGEAFWGKGIATAAVRDLSTYGLKELGLTRIFGVPLISSTASMRVLEKAGYVREGVLRRSAIKEGNVLDQVLYALTDMDLSP
jgi:[ribosomal protein S5]-alanine N-acetyltransferase